MVEPSYLVEKQEEELLSPRARREEELGLNFKKR
jgi:hypothetical protein